MTVPAGGTLSTVSATAGGTPIALTGSGNTRTGTAPAEAGPLVVTATGEDADGTPLTANRTVQVREEPVAPTAPGQFGASDWDVTTGPAAGEIVLNITALPWNGGSPFTVFEQTVDGGSTWTALSGTGTGFRTLTMPAAGTSYTFALRAVNAVGAGAASASRSATSGADAPGMVAFAPGDWSLLTGLAAEEARLTINNIPTTGATAVEYTNDGGVTCYRLSAAATGTYTLKMAAASAFYPFMIRAVKDNERTEWSAPKSTITGSGVPAAAIPADFQSITAIIILGASHSASSWGTQGNLGTYLSVAKEDFGFGSIPILPYPVSGSDSFAAMGRYNEVKTNATVSAISGKRLWMLDYSGNDLRSDNAVVATRLKAVADAIVAAGDLAIIIPQTKRTPPLCRC